MAGNPDTVWEQVRQVLEKGEPMHKVRRKLYQRHYWLDTEVGHLVYKSKRKHPTDPRVHFPIQDINEVRKGVATDTFKNKMHLVEKKVDMENPGSCCFSVLLQDGRVLDLLADSQAKRDRWVLGIKGYIEKLANGDLQEKKELALKGLFQSADKNGNGALNLKEIGILLDQLNITVDEKDTKRAVKEFGLKTGQKSDESLLTYGEFKNMYQAMTHRDEVKKLFTKHNIEGEFLDATELQSFFREELGENLTEKECQKLIEKYEPLDDIKKQGQMGIDGMYALLASDMMDIFNRRHNSVYQDMSQPLCDYFIDSSHNTYLSDDQLVGDSTVESYIQALLWGCRCVELDCWDGYAGEPSVYHGHTMTSEIKFSDILKAIYNYAFKTSEYPVILSLENHCSDPQQARMAYHLKKILKEKLYTGPLPPGCKALPSPDDLKGKIIIKAKEPKKSADKDSDSEDEYEEPKTKSGKKSAPCNKDTKVQISNELASLLVICVGSHFTDFVLNPYPDLFTKISSFGENKAKKLIETRGDEWVMHNRIQLSRIYPAGLRFGSSNYEPVPMWSCGNQVVALNYQTPGEDMHQYKGFFMDNGKCGFVLKPEYLRKGQPLNPNGPYPKEWKKKLFLKVISGYRLPKDSDVLDPYVEVDVAGPGQEKQKEKTKKVKNNGFHPVWNTDTFKFDIAVPELTLIRFYVKDDDHGSDPVVAQFSLPFKCMEAGYRVVHLKTTSGKLIDGAELFVHVRIA